MRSNQSINAELEERVGALIDWCTPGGDRARLSGQAMSHDGLCRAFKVNARGTTMRIGIPGSIAALLPPDMAYRCELTEEGILFRPVGSTAPPSAPEWTRRTQDVEGRR